MVEHLPQDQNQHSLWGETAIANPTESQLLESLQADVLVVGAGYTGLSCALHLAEQGVSVVLLEAKSIGFGGSGRNAGLVNAGTWCNPDHVIKHLGADAGQRFNLALQESPKLVFELIKRFAMPCQGTRGGTINIAHSASAMAYLEDRCRQLQALGAGVQMIDGARAQALSGSPVYRHGGILDAAAGTLQPLSYVRSLAATARDLGVKIFQRSAIKRLARQNDCWLATTATGAVAAEQVVIATNAYADAGSQGVRDSTLPVFIFQCATAPLAPDVAAAIIPERQGLWDTQTLMTSSRIDADGRLIMSGAGNLCGWQGKIRVNWMSRIRDRLYPQAAGSDWVYQWSGRIGVTSRKILRVQLLAPGIFAPAGYNGRGIAPGTAIGKHLAQTMLSGNRDDFPFPIEALYREKWSGLRAGYYNYATLGMQLIDNRFRGA